MSKAIYASGAPQFPLPFSHAIQSGDFVFVSGQVGVDPVSREVVGPTIEEQTAQCLRNIEAILAEVGLTLDHIVKLNAYLSRIEDLAAYNRTYETLLNKPFPARTTLVSGIGNYLIEIDAIAYAASRRGEHDPCRLCETS